MTHVKWITGVIGLMLLGGCSNHSSGVSTTSNTGSTPASSNALTPPSNPGDVNGWRAFMGEEILGVTHDAKVHPYSFVVPPGDTEDVIDQRSNQAKAIRMMLGNTAVPGNMVALTGPDSGKVAEVILDAFKGLPPHKAEGLSVIYVGEPSAAIEAKKAVSSAGAVLHIQPISTR